MGKTGMAIALYKEGIAAGRLAPSQYADNFSDLHPPLDQHEALWKAAGEADPYASAAEFVRDLDVIHDSLVANKSRLLARGRLRRLIRSSMSSGVGGPRRAWTR